MKHRSQKIIRACQMAFNGKTNKQVADVFDVSPTTVSNWRKSELWHETENALIAAEKQAAVESQRSICADAVGTVQG